MENKNEEFCEACQINIPGVTDKEELIKEVFEEQMEHANGSVMLGKMGEKGK